MKNITIQMIPLVAIALWAMAYQMRVRRIILTLQTISCSLFAIHFALLGASAGMAFSVMAASRFLLFSFKRKNNWISKPIVLWTILLLHCIYSAVTIKSPWEIFVLAGTIIATLGSWQENPRAIRKMFVPSHILWIIYDLSIGSWGGAISEAISGISTLIALFRKDLR